MSDWMEEYREYERQCIEAARMPEGNDREVAVRNEAFQRAEALRAKLMLSPDAPKVPTYSSRQKIITSIAAWLVLHGTKLSGNQRELWVEWVSEPADKTPPAHVDLESLVTEWRYIVEQEKERLNQLANARWITVERNALKAADCLKQIGEDISAAVANDELREINIQAEAGMRALIELSVDLSTEICDEEITRLVAAKPLHSPIQLAELIVHLESCAELLGSMQASAGRGDHDLLKQQTARFPRAYTPKMLNELRWEVSVLAGKVTAESRRTQEEVPTPQAAKSLSDGLSEDGRTLRWGGNAYPIPPTAVKPIKLLLKSYENGFPFLSEAFLMEEGECETEIRILVKNSRLESVVVRQVGQDGKTVRGMWGLVDPNKNS